MATKLVRVETPRIKKKEIIPEEEVRDEVELEDVKREEASCSNEATGKEDATKGNTTEVPEKEKENKSDMITITGCGRSFNMETVDHTAEEENLNTSVLNPNAIKAFLKFAGYRGTITNCRRTFREVFNTVLNFKIIKFDVMFAKENLLRFLNCDTVLEFLAYAEKHKRLKICTENLFSVLKTCVYKFQHVILDSATVEQFMYYVCYLNLTDPSVSLNLILQWYQRDPKQRQTLSIELIDYVNLKALNYETFMSFADDYEILRADYRMQKKIIEKMSIDQTNILVCHQNTVDVYELEEFGHFMKTARWQIPPKYRILKAFFYGSMKYIVALTTVEDGRVLSLWQRSDEDNFKKTCNLLFLETPFFVTAMGPRILIVVPSAMPMADADNETSIYCFNIIKQKLELLSVLKVPFVTNQIECSRSSLYLLHFNAEKAHYDRILRFYLEEREKQLLSLKSFRENTWRWERAMCCNDSLIILSFTEHVEKGIPVEYPNNIMTVHTEHLFRSWISVKREFPWKRMNHILEFYEETVPKHNEYFFYPVMNFLGDDDAIFFLNEKYKCYHKKRQLLLEDGVTHDNITNITVAIKRK